MYKLYHQEEFLFESEDKEEVFKELSRHLKDVLKYKSYYQRRVEVEDNRTMIDYGSYTKFYYIVK
jgi:hypothetical protein